MNMEKIKILSLCNYYHYLFIILQYKYFIQTLQAKYRKRVLNIYIITSITEINFSFEIKMYLHFLPSKTQHRLLVYTENLTNVHLLKTIFTNIENHTINFETVLLFCYLIIVARCTAVKDNKFCMAISIWIHLYPEVSQYMP